MKYRHTYTVQYEVTINIETDERDGLKVPDADIARAAKTLIVRQDEPTDVSIVESYNLDTQEYYLSEDLDDEDDDDDEYDYDEDDPEEDDDEQEIAPLGARYKFEPTNPYGEPLPGVPPQTMTLQEFMDDNKEATEEAERMEELAVGDTTMIGGGAAQGYRVTREA